MSLWQRSSTTVRIYPEASAGLIICLLLTRSYGLEFKTHNITVYRPRDILAVEEARRSSFSLRQCVSIEWEERMVSAPDVHDKSTLIQLARMSGNAYALPGQDNWYDLDPVWYRSFPVGWQNPVDGFRGHAFLSSDNSTVVLSIKGTTIQGPTSKADKLNDNLLFSCCCARVDISWALSTVCDCYASNWRCDNVCLSNALIQDSLFYSIGVDLIRDLRSMFPDANIILTGHSLGGALASLLGTTFGLPAVAFESPGERLAGTRLYLPIPPSMLSSTGVPNYSMAPVIHVYHTADPVPNGVCNGIGSPCRHAGYALETKCHLGKTILYDTVKTLGWGADIRKHSINEVIHNVVEADVLWGFGQKVPRAREETDCVDCFKWEFGDFKSLKDEDGT